MPKSSQSKSSKIVTRFAPSPTGFLHIGGARTALFNHYFALAAQKAGMGGEMRLRIEDTDRARSTDEATQAILDGLDWLGVPHDGEVVYQSARADRHVEVAHMLLDAGAAYRDHLTPEESEAVREQAKVDGVAYRSPYRDKDGDGRHTVRLRIPAGVTTIADAVQGDVTWENDQLEDLVLLRADGTPTYMLAVVADDHDMGVTHVIRGDDHLVNAAKQQVIYEALGWDVPAWTHVPLIFGPDGKKLSKRHGALGVEAYRDMGYLAPAMRNYLVRLGWAHGDDEIFLSDQSIADVFTLSGINSSPSRLDFDKMDFVNAQHIEQMEEGALIEAALPFLDEERGQALSDIELTRLRAALPTLRPRAKTLKDLARVAAWLFPVPAPQMTGKPGKPFRREGVGELLSALTSKMESLEDAQWTSPSLHSLLEEFVADRDIGFGTIGQPVRAALTRGLPSPDLADVLAILGREETLARITDVVQMIERDT